MIVSFKRIAIVCLSMMVLAGNSFAGENVSKTRISGPRGVYLDVGIGTNFLTLENSQYSATAFGSLGGNANLGFYVNDYFAPEIGYTYYFSDLQATDIAAKGILRLDVGQYGANVFGKIGASYLFSEYDAGWYPLVGIGAGLGVSENIDWNVQAQAVTNTVGNNSASLGLISTGITYNFG